MDVYNFISNRLRALKQDMTVHNTPENLNFVRVNESAVRF